MRRAALAIAASLLVAPAPAAAAADPWLVRLQLGSAKIHDYSDADTWCEIRVGRVLAGEWLSADVGPSGSHSGEGYVALTLGIDVVPLPRSIVSPYARVEAGSLWEPEGFSAVRAFGVGLAVRASGRVAVRAGASWGAHGDDTGPVVYSGGVQLRW